MDFIEMIAEQRIREAIERGELKDLSYEGRPVEIEDLSGIPEELRMTYKILKNANILPEEMDLKKEISSLHNLIDACTDEAEKAFFRKNLHEKTLRLNILMDKRKVSASVWGSYKTKVIKKLGI